MQKVLVAVEKITVQSTEMDSRMEGKMLDVQKVIDMRVLVKQMEKLQELPERMETLIQNGEAHEAVKVFGSEKHNFNQCREIARFAVDGSNFILGMIVNRMFGNVWKHNCML